MSEREFTKHDLETHERIARIEEKLEVILDEVCGFKKKFWRIFAPVATAVSGLIATLSAKLFHHT